jgi:PAS domain S-box-containing protein
LENILGYRPGYLIGKLPYEFIHPDDLKSVSDDLSEVYLKTNTSMPTEFRFRKADGTWVYLEAIGQNLLEDPAINGIVITARDISERKRVEKELKTHRVHLEDLVRERTKDLRNAYEKLREENDNRKAVEYELNLRKQELEEMNSALHVLLKQRKDDRVNMEMNIMSNIKTSVLPYIEKLELSGLAEGQIRVTSLMKSLLGEITSPFIRNATSEFLGFTPHEVQVASLIKEGKSSKEIAEILNISLNTVHTYRYKIRIKTGLKNNKVNLRSYLQTLE